MQKYDETTAAAREALVDAIAGEHRLRRQAVKEQQEAERWTQRASFAAERDLAELAEGARARAARHVRLANLLAARADEVQEEVRLLRATIDATRRAGRAPPDSVEARFAELELEAELDRIRAAKRGEVAPPQPSESS